MKLKLSKLQVVILLIPLFFFLAGCSEIGFVNQKSMVSEINGVGDFFRVYLTLQFSIFIISLLLSIFISRLGYVVTLILHFVWVVSYRDYGFLMVFLLFSLFTIGLFLFKFFIVFIGSIFRR